MKTKHSFGLAIGVLGLILAGVAWATPYDIIDLGTLGGSYSLATGINNNGQVVGDSNRHAFLYSSGVMTDLGADTYATSINDNGQVIGYSGSRSTVTTYNAFFYSSGVMNNISTNAVATGINNNGQVVGYTLTSENNPQHAFLYSDGVMADIGEGTVYSIAYAINNNSQVAGYNVIGYDNAFIYSGGEWNYKNQQDLTGYAINDIGQVAGYDGQHAFLYGNGVKTDLGTLGSNYSIAFGINDSGQVVGTSMIYGNFASHAFLYQNGNMIDLNSLIDPISGWTLWSANAINNNGQIVGSGVTSGGQQHAFLLTPTGEPFPEPVKPVPEPSALFLLISGIVALAGTGKMIS